MFSVSFYCFEEISDFIERFKGDSLDSCVAVHHVDMNLRPKFGSGMSFSSDDRSYPMLADTDDLVRDAVRSVLIHEQLLLIERCQDIQQIIDCLIKFDPLVPNETNDVADIPPDVLQLLPDAFPDRFLSSLLALGKIQEILACLLAVCPRHSPSMFIADIPDCLFQQFSRMIQ